MILSTHRTVVDPTPPEDDLILANYKSHARSPTMMSLALILRAYYIVKQRFHLGHQGSAMTLAAARHTACVGYVPAGLMSFLAASNTVSSSTVSTVASDLLFRNVWGTHRFYLYYLSQPSGPAI